MNGLALALHQGRGVAGDIEATLARTQAIAQHAREQGADLLLLPELWASGYGLDPERLRALARPAAAWAADYGEIAREHRIALALGCPEQARDRPYNSAILLDPDGRLRLLWRKSHLFGGFEHKAFRAGADAPAPVALGDWRIALLICYEVEFPELVRIAALKGADLLLVPTAVMAPYARIPARLLPARALENGLYLAYANRIGREGPFRFTGRSMVLDPEGTIRLKAGAREEGLWVVRMERTQVAAARARNPYLADRRPGLYRDLSRAMAPPRER